MDWQVPDAGQRFSELLGTAHVDGPQIVTRHGVEIAVVIDIAEYRHLRGEAEEWGRMNVPDPLPVIDGLLAASAKTRGWTLVTCDTSGLTRTGVALLNPFGAPAGS